MLDVEGDERREVFGLGRVLTDAHIVLRAGRDPLRFSLLDARNDLAPLRLRVDQQVCDQLPPLTRVDQVQIDGYSLLGRLVVAPSDDADQRAALARRDQALAIVGEFKRADLLGVAGHLKLRALVFELEQPHPAFGECERRQDRVAFIVIAKLAIR